MKGMERQQLYNIVIIVICLLLLIMVIAAPALIQVVRAGGQITFREACIFWSLNYYKEREAVNPETGEVYSMDMYCAQALGLLEMPDDLDALEWESCRDLCRAKA